MLIIEQVAWRIKKVNKRVEADIYIYIGRWSLAVETRHKYRAALSQVEQIEVGHAFLYDRAGVVFTINSIKLLECPNIIYRYIQENEVD